MKTPKLWKHLKRHPLSARYKDLVGDRWDKLLSGVKEDGFDKAFPITLAPDLDDDSTLKVLDGWQRLRACIECDVEPSVVAGPGDLDAQEKYVKRHNDARRHETEEEKRVRIEAEDKAREERRQREAELRAQGNSFRKIAEQVGVDVATVHRDLDSAPSVAEVEDATPGAAENPEIIERREKVAELKAEGKSNREIAKELGVGEATIRRDLESMEEDDEPEQDPEPVKPTPPEPAKPEVPRDENGDEWPSRALPAVALSPKLKDISRRVANIMAELSAKDSSGELELALHSYSITSVIAALKTAKETLLGGCPAFVCPYCDGTLKVAMEGHQKGKQCQTCGHQGWVSRSTYKQSPKGHSAKFGADR